MKSIIFFWWLGRSFSPSADATGYIVGQTGFLMNLRPRPACSWPSGRQDIRHRDIQVANGLDTGCQRHGWL